MALADKLPVPSLADDSAARPDPYRAADFGGRFDKLCIDGTGLASDSYVMVPATTVTLGTKDGRTAADLESGVYSVPKLGVDPLRIKDGPNMLPLIPDERDLVDAKPYELDGIGWVHVQTGEMYCAVFVTEDGRFVAIDRDKLPIGEAQHESVEVPAFFGRQPRAVRWSIKVHKGHATRPCLFTRRAYGRATQAKGGSHTYVSGEWQAVVMPVRLPK